MPSFRAIQITKAIRRTNKKAAREYLDQADLREKISFEARQILEVPSETHHAGKVEDARVCVDGTREGTPKRALPETSDSGTSEAA